MTRRQIEQAAEEFRKLRRAGSVFDFAELVDFGEQVAREASGFPAKAWDYLHALQKSIDALTAFVRAQASTGEKGKTGCF